MSDKPEVWLERFLLLLMNTRQEMPIIIITKAGMTNDKAMILETGLLFSETANLILVMNDGVYLANSSMCVFLDYLEQNNLVDHVDTSIRYIVDIGLFKMCLLYFIVNLHSAFVLSSSRFKNTLIQLK